MQHIFAWYLGNIAGGENGYPLQYSCLETPWTDESGGLQSLACKGSDMTEPLSTHTQGTWNEAVCACPRTERCVLGLRKTTRKARGETDRLEMILSR